jgi:hypothetical protein
MADIELVIKIPEDYYEALRKTDLMISGQRSGKTLMSVIYGAVAKGTPLPKHHTDLIERRCGNEVCNGCEHSDICDIYNAPTIIEAEGSEQNDD